MFDIFVNPLSDGVPFYNTNANAGEDTDYYVYTVSTNAVRAQFEINGPSGEMTLVARKGLPPPTLSSYSLISANPGTNDQLIVLFNSSRPVPLTPGDWYISAVNVSGAPVTYAVRATEFPISGINIVITNSAITADGLCLTWTSLPGVEYYVQGKPDLLSTNWVPVSPTVTASDVQATYCVPLPSPFHFFRIHEGLVIVPPAVTLRIASITHGPEWRTARMEHAGQQPIPGAMDDFAVPAGLEYVYEPGLLQPTVLPPSWTMAPNPAAWAARAITGCCR